MKTISSLTLCLVALVVACCGILCKRMTTPAVQKSRMNNAPNTQATLLSDQRDLNADWQIIRMNSKTSLSRIGFIDVEHGWVSDNEHSLFKTTDGGRSWYISRVPLPSGAYLTSFYFVNNAQGWIAYVKHSPEGQESSLLYTENAGQTWTPQVSNQSGYIHAIRVLNEREGWAVGSRSLEKASLRRELLVLHTSNGGRDWTDLSGQLNGISQGNDGDSDFLVDVLASETNGVVVLSAAGHLFSSHDDGRSWQRLNEISKEPYETNFVRLGYDPNAKVWVLGGADTGGGVWGFLGIRESDNEWVQHRLSVRLKDAAYISTTEMLACGSMVSRDRKSPWDSKRDGVILYSSDLGAKWTVVYRNPEIKQVNALAVLNAADVWAAGDAGLILHWNSSSSLSAKTAK